MARSIAVLGMQWGDEGKGKVIDFLAKKANVIARFNGGNNAGHTMVVNGEKTVLHIMPSGMLHKNKIGVIGNGMVIDPKLLLEEMDIIRNAGLIISPDNLMISSSAHVILPPHIELDKRSTVKSLGTTAKGIGPCYASKAARKGLRMHQLLDKKYFRSRFGDDPFFEEYAKYAEKLRPYVENTAYVMDYAFQKNKRILFEGAQAALLDIDHGTYPFVTSSNCTAGGICTGLGIPPSKVGQIMGVIKAYTTRVGTGPFPTELGDETGKFLAKQGNEFGSTTGRQRRCGWFDAIIGKYAVMLNGVDSIALTKLDVFNGMRKIKLCTSYKYKGKKMTTFPVDAGVLGEVEPVYETFDGWWDDLSKVKGWDTLPANAKKYLRRIESLLGVPVSILGVGPGREQTIVMRPEFMF